MPGPGDLYAACLSLKAVCLAALASTPAGAANHFSAVYPGQPAMDCCPMLAVWWTPITRPSTAPSQDALDLYHRNRVWVNVVQFNILALRCDASIPDGSGMPNQASLEVAAKQVADDAWALNEYVSARILDNTLFGTYPCEEVAITPIQQLTPQGGFAGCQFQLQAVIQGYAA